MKLRVFSTIVLAIVLACLIFQVWYVAAYFTGVVDSLVLMIVNLMFGLVNVINLIVLIPTTVDSYRKKL